MTSSKRWYQSRTIWFNLISFIVSLSTALSASPEVKESWIPILLTIQLVGNYLLRLDTRQPIH